MILSRKVNEGIQIGDNIELVVIDIVKGQVKLGFKAPPEVLILREELVPHRADNASAANGEDS